MRIDAEAGKVDATVPWLEMSDSLRSMQWSDGNGEHSLSLSVRPSENDHRLVGIAGDVGTIVSRLFPEKKANVRLDPTQKLLAYLSAWEMLDAIVLDPAAAATIDESQ